jgi:hypothetical protein
MKKVILCMALTCAATADAQTVRVHVDAPPHVVIEEEGASAWTRLCSAPCDRELDVRGMYRSAGPDVQRQRFVLDKAATVHIEPGSRTVNILGIVLAPIGGGTLLAGLLASALATLQADGTSTAFVGAVLIGVGAATALSGIIMYALSKTSISFSF